MITISAANGTGPSTAIWPKVTCSPSTTMPMRRKVRDAKSSPRCVTAFAETKLSDSPTSSPSRMIGKPEWSDSHAAAADPAAQAARPAVHQLAMRRHAQASFNT